MVDKIGNSPETYGSLGTAGTAGVRRPPTVARPGGAADGLAFDQVLQETLRPEPRGSVPPGESALSEVDLHRVRFSAHAQQRLAQAAVQLGPQALATLEAAVDKAGSKGGRESLILLDDLAFIVSVKNRTVITAVGADRMTDNVFTKIDSVVIARQTGGAESPEGVEGA